MLAGRTPRLLFPHKDRLVTPNLPKYVPLAREQGYFVLKFKVPTKIPIPPEPAPADTKSSSQKLSLYASPCQPFASLTFARPLSLAELGDIVIPLEDKETSFGESDDTSHVSTGITGTLSTPVSFSPSLPSVYLLPLPQHSPSSSLSIPPTSILSQRLPSGIATAVHVHGHANYTGYTRADFALHEDADALVNMTGIMLLNQSSDVGLDVGSYGGAYAASTSAYEQRYHHQQQQQQQQPHMSHLPPFSSMTQNMSSSDPHQHQQFTTLPPPTLPVLPTTVYPVQFQHNPPPQRQQLHSQYLPPLPLPPTHHPPVPPSLIPRYPTSPTPLYTPHLSQVTQEGFC